MRRHALWIARAMARTDLSPLQPADVEALEAICRARHVAAGTVVVPAGSPVDAVYVVRSGEVQLALRRPLGGRQLVGLVREGGVVADIPMFCEQPMPFDAVTGTDSTVIELDRDRLVALLQRSPSLSLRWTSSVAKRLEQTQRRMIAMLTKDLEAQVATVLLDERQRSAAGGWFVPLSHGAISQLLGVRRQSVSRVIAGLRGRGLVAGGYRRLGIVDLEGLAHVAGVSLDDVACGAA